MLIKHNHWMPALVLAAAAVGCGSEPAAPVDNGVTAGTLAPAGLNPSGVPGQFQSPAFQAPPTAPALGTPTAPSAPSFPGSSGFPGLGGPSVGDASPAAPAAPAAGGFGADGVPCNVATAIQNNCTMCHGAEVRFSAPMPLVTLADFMAPAKSDPSRTVAELVKARINGTEGALMPPPPTSMSGEDLAAVNAWLDGGAAAGAACGGDPALTPGADGALTETPEAEDPSVQCFEFRAHAPGSTTEPYKVGRAVDSYFNFSFNSPWQGKKYAKSFKVIVDNDKVLHHWLFYKEIAKGAEGAIAPSLGAHPGSELVHGWAPGGEDLIMPQEAAIEMPETGWTLEFHYNSSDPNALDKSGIEVCVRDTPPDNVATLSWLGTIAFFGTTTASGTCTPGSQQPIRIIGGTPHMHTQGKHMKVELIRSNGQIEMIHDQPFDFNYQVSYDFKDRDLWVMPGDSIRTTCTFATPASFGEGTSSEMCYFFTLAYPGGALSMPGVGTAIHGPTACIPF